MDVDKAVEQGIYWLMQTIRLGAIIFFFYCTYEGLFKGGGSTMIFLGVLALSSTLVICYFIEQLPKVLKR